MIRVGIIGCGAIGTEICVAIDRNSYDGRDLGLDMRLFFVIDRNEDKIKRLCERLSNPPAVRRCGSNAKEVGFDDIVEEVDLVIECASQHAVREFVIPALEFGKDVMILSVGALADENMLRRVEHVARKNRCRVYIPSGAIAGIDGLKSAAVSRIYEVRLTTRKPPESFADNKYVRERGIDIERKEPTVLFEGSAIDAVRYFPENVNVAAALSIAGIGTRKTHVTIIADPSVRENMHEINISGSFGKMCIKIENIPSPINTKTSYLAAMSAIATLKTISNPINVGT